MVSNKKQKIFSTKTLLPISPKPWDWINLVRMTMRGWWPKTVLKIKQQPE